MSGLVCWLRVCCHGWRVESLEASSWFSRRQPPCSAGVRSNLSRANCASARSDTHRNMHTCAYAYTLPHLTRGHDNPWMLTQQWHKRDEDGLALRPTCRVYYWTTDSRGSREPSARAISTPPPVQHGHPSLQVYPLSSMATHSTLTDAQHIMP